MEKQTRQMMSDSWHYGGDNPHPTKNDWKGTFSDSTKQTEFEAITTEVPRDANLGSTFSNFGGQTGLTAISLPLVTEVGIAAFRESPLTEINIPKLVRLQNGSFYKSAVTNIHFPEVTIIDGNAFNIQVVTKINFPKVNTIRDHVFFRIPDLATTQVSLPIKFNTTAEKDRIFKSGGISGSWGQITFHWINADGTGGLQPTTGGLNAIVGDSTSNQNAGNRVIWNEKICDTQYDWNGKVVSKFIYNGKECVLKPLIIQIGDTACPIDGNRYTGTFSNVDKQNAFCSITTNVPVGAFGVKDVDTGLTEVSMPEVIKVGNHAFEYQPLTKLSMPKCTSAGVSSFFHALLTELELPECTNLDYYSFSYSPLTKLSIPKAVYIGRQAFYSAKLTSLDIPEATHIWSEAFNNAEITTLNAPKLGIIDGWAFNNAKITSLDLPEAKYIGDWAFAYSPITSLNLPECITIREGAFVEAITKTINLPECTNIGKNAFYKASFTDLNLPKALVIDDGAFINAPNLATTNITMLSYFNSESEKTRLFGDQHENITFHWITHDTNSYEGTWSSSSKETEFNAITTTVAYQEFKGQRSITSMTLPNVETIDSQAFHTMENLKYLELPKVKSMDVNVFWGCKISALNLPEVTSLGASCMGNSNLYAISMPKVISIGDLAFSHSTITNLDIPECTTIGRQAFYNSPLTNINIPKATTIGDSVFRTVINAKRTKVTMKSKFNTQAEKNRIFRPGGWELITFTWVD